MSKRELFGGAIVCDVPMSYTDVSQFRQIPDHQEVFAEAETDRSVIVEIMEMSSDNEKIGTTYWNEIAEHNRSVLNYNIVEEDMSSVNFNTTMPHIQAEPGVSPESRTTTTTNDGASDDDGRAQSNRKKERRKRRESWLPVLLPSLSYLD